MTDEWLTMMAAARCLSAIRRYHAERSEAARGRMIAEVRSIVEWLIELELPSGVADEQILAPVEDLLLARHGHEAGRRINAEFVEAFEECGMSLLSRGRPAPPSDSLRDSSTIHGGGLVDYRVGHDGRAKVRATIAARLRSRRVKLFGESGGGEIARRLGLPTRTWLNYEAGVTIPGEDLARFLALTRTDPGWLLDGARPNPLPTPPAGDDVKGGIIWRTARLDLSGDSGEK